nr:serum response factor [Plutella xylostella]
MPCPGPRGQKRPADQCYDERPAQTLGMEHCPMPDISDDYASLQPKKSPPSNGKKTKGRVKIKMEYIDNKLRRYTTFSKRKTGIMKKAYELSTLTGTQVMLLVASETGHVYTFATRKLQPMITSDSGKRLIQTCLNSPDPPQTSEQRMAATGFEETELTYNVVDDDMKVRQLAYQSAQYPLEHHPGLAPSPLQQYHQHPPCPSPLPLGSLGQPYSHPHLTHPHMSHHPQR